MFRSIALADEIIQTVVNVVRRGDRAQLRTLDAFPAALYAIDGDGFVSYFNPLCVDFAGRHPTIGRDRWCVTWKLYTDEGEFLPHDQCPMAVAVQTGQAIRGITAIAERPDGTRVNFLPFPTPVIGHHGEILGAVNMLIDVSGFHQHLLRELYGDLQTWQGMLVEQSLSTFTAEEIRKLIREIERKSVRRPPRSFH